MLPVILVSACMYEILVFKIVNYTVWIIYWNHIENLEEENLSEFMIDWMAEAHGDKGCKILEYETLKYVNFCKKLQVTGCMHDSAQLCIDIMYKCTYLSHMEDKVPLM